MGRPGGFSPDAILLALVQPVLAILTAITLAVWFWSAVDYWLDHRANTVVSKWYDGKFAALWHPDDEPIGGLRATMLPPYRITYRRPQRGSFQLLRRLSNATVSLVADELVWQLVMQKLQGSDRRGRTLRRVEPVPQYCRETNALPPSAVAAISQSASLQTASTAGGLRTRLASLANYHSSYRAIRSLGREITWKELIHNSYYRDAAVIEALASHISGASIPRLPGAPAKVGQYKRRPPFESRILPAAAAFVIAVMALVLFMPARLVFLAVIFPVSNEAQLLIIAEAMKQPEIISQDYRISGDNFLDKAISLLSEASYPSISDEFLPLMTSPSTRSIVAESLAHDFAYRGKEAELAQLLNRVRNIAPDNARLLAAVYANAFLGSIAADREAGNEVLQFLAKNNQSIACKERYLCVQGELAFTVEKVWHARGYDSKGTTLVRSDLADFKTKCSLSSDVDSYLVRLGINPLQESNCEPASPRTARKLAMIAIEFGRHPLAEEILKSSPGWEDAVVSPDRGIVDSNIIDVVEILSALGRQEDLKSRAEYLFGKISPAWPVSVADYDRERIIRLAARFLKNGEKELGEKLLATTLKAGSDLFPVASVTGLNIKLAAFAVKELSAQEIPERAKTLLEEMKEFLLKQSSASPTDAEDLAHVAEAYWWIGDTAAATATLAQSLARQGQKLGQCSLMRSNFETLFNIGQAEQGHSIRDGLADCIRKSRNAARSNPTGLAGQLSSVVEAWAILGHLREARIAAESGHDRQSTITANYCTVIRRWIALKGKPSSRDPLKELLRPALVRVDD